jgi:hypothetical protein
MIGDNQRSFAEIEVTPEAIVIRRDILRQMNDILISVAEKLEAAKSPWDRTDVDGEEAFFAINSTIAAAIKSAIREKS